MLYLSPIFCDSRVKLKRSGIAFFIMFIDLMGLCGGILTESEGEITSLNKGDDSVYQNNLDCRWLIISDGEGVVQLRFHRFDVEKHVSCDYDYVQVISSYYY